MSADIPPRAVAAIRVMFGGRRLQNHVLGSPRARALGQRRPEQHDHGSRAPPRRHIGPESQVIIRRARRKRQCPASDEAPGERDTGRG